uniref:Uncharacterized protein n=2 Tax=Cajanus cajan TaxID=3821 RepID=A0A151UIP0_CAJCA
MTIKPKSMRCTKVIMPTREANDSVNAMNLITTSWDNQNPSTPMPQDHVRNHCLTDVLQDFDINDVLMSYEDDDCHFNGYAEAGRVDIARELFERIPVKDVISWGAGKVSP